jgi:hypothetical protein
MAKVDTYYSIRDTDRRVHHNNNKCTEGKLIESYVRSSGSENRPLCEECETLNGAEPLVTEEDRPGLAASFISAVRKATGWRPPAGS